MKRCSHCNKSKPLDDFYNSYSFRQGKNRVTGKRKQCKICVGKAKNKPALNAYVDTKPIGDPVVCAGMKAWGRALEDDKT